VRLFGDAPVALRRSVADRRRIVIRRADGADREALDRLAALTERETPDAPVLLAEADGLMVAALSLPTGRVVSDPFVASGDVVALLRLRAEQLDDAA
jgi:hypothetical protein